MRFNHAYSFGFEVLSNSGDAEDVTGNTPMAPPPASRLAKNTMLG